MERKPEIVNWMHNGKMYQFRSYWNVSQGGWMWQQSSPSDSTLKERRAAAREFHKSRSPVQ